MKNFTFLLAALVLCYVSLFEIEEKVGLYKVAILSATGQVIWPFESGLDTEDLPCDTHTSKSVENLIQDLEIDLPHSYLTYMQAKYLKIWKNQDGGYVEIDKRKFKKRMNTLKKSARNIDRTEVISAERSDWRSRRKGGSTPGQVRVAQKDFRSKFKSSKNRDGNISTWHELGPDNIGGRTRAIAILSDPNAIIAATAGGGLIRGEFNTSSSEWEWTPISDFSSTLAFSCIAVDRSGDEDIIYAGSGEFFSKCIDSDCGGPPGDGIYKSIDGGISFFKLDNPAGADMYWISEIVIDPSNPQKIFALENGVSQSGNSGGVNKIHRSLDGGQTWLVPVTTYTSDFGTHDLIQLNDIKIHPSDPSRIYINQTTTGYKNGDSYLLESLDGGNTFSSKLGFGNTGRGEIAFSATGDTVYYSIYFNSGALYRSTNGGDDWSFLTAFNYICSPTSASNCPGRWAHPLWVDPLDADKIIVGGVDLFAYDAATNSSTQITDWRDFHNGDDTDSDGNVANSLHADHHFIVESVDYSAGNRKVYFSNDGGVGYTNDITSVSQNTGWHLAVDNGYSASQFYTGAAHSDVTLGGTQDNAPLYTNDSQTGLDWVQESTGDGGYCAVRPSNSDHYYVSTQNGRLYRTLTGTDWDFFAFFDLDCLPDFPSYCNGGTTAENLFYADDDPDFIAPFKLDPTDENSLYFGARRLWKNSNCWSNSSNSYSIVKNGVLGNPKISAIDISETDGSVIWVGYNDGRLERSSDGGTSWSGDIRPVVNINVEFITDVEVNPHNNNIVAVSFGGYFSDNLWITYNANAAIPTWQNINPGVNVQINAIEWHPLASMSSSIYLGTDFGVLASDNNGGSWLLDPLYNGNEGPSNVEVSDIFWETSAAGDVPILYAATHGRGMWKSNYAQEDKIYVDKNHSGVEDGSIDFPYNTVQEAVVAAQEGDEIVILSSTNHINPSSFIIDKRVKLSLGPNSTGVIIE